MLLPFLLHWSLSLSLCFCVCVCLCVFTLSLKSQEQRRIRRRSSGESPAPVLSRHPAAGHAELLRYTELSFRDPYPALHINCNQDMIKQGQPQACYL